LPSPRPRRTRAAGHLKLSLEPLARLSVHRQSRHRRRRRRVPLPAPNYLPAPASTTRLLLPLPLPLPELTPPPPDRPAAPPSACSVQQGAHQGRPADGARRPYLEPRNQLKSTRVSIPSLPSPSTGQIRCSPAGISPSAMPSPPRDDIATICFYPGRFSKTRDPCVISENKFEPPCKCVIWVSAATSKIR
jgi:hypothetical protein